MRILVVEDDKILSNTICESLGARFDYDQAFDGEEGLYLAERNIYDAIILDIMMPVMNGYQVISMLRDKGISTPVLILTARDSIDDKVRGFKQGADDYLVKPFHRQELQVRIESLIRRAGGVLKENTLKFHDLTLNYGNRTANVNNKELIFSGRQFDVLEYLICNKNIILTKRQIFDKIWGFNSETTPTVIDVYVSNIRKELQCCHYDKYIKTVRGLGYMLTDNIGDNE